MSAWLPRWPRRVGLDLRGDRLYFAETRLALEGHRLERVGVEAPRDGESVEDMLVRLGASRWLQQADVVMALRHPDLRIERLELPPLSPRDARTVAQRRAADLASSLLEPACTGFSVAPGRESRPAWLAACPEEFSRFGHRRWTGRGITVSRFVSLQFAFGSLSQLLPAPPAGELRAFLDLADGFSTCVLADAHGWVFSRELSIKITGDPTREDGIDMLERLAAEMRRTFHYVAAELRIGEVGSLVISGESENFEDLKWRLEQSLGVGTSCIDEEPLEDVPEGFERAAACALGLVQAPNPDTANLLPPEVKRARSRQVVRSRLATALAVSGALALALVTHFGITVHSLTDQTQALESLWEETEAERAEVHSFARVRQRGRELDAAFARVAEPQPPWAHALEALGRLLPDDAVLDRAHGIHDDRWGLELHVEFRAEDLAGAAAAAARFRTALDASPLFRVRSTERSDAPGRPDEAFVRVRMRIATEIAASEPSERIARVGVDRG